MIVRRSLAAKAMPLGRRLLDKVATLATPETLLNWHRKLIANKFDGSRFRRRVGRPRIDQEIERLVVQMAKEKPGWGYDRIAGALANLGYAVSDQTVGNILRRRGLSPAPNRKQAMSWKDFIRSHRDVLVGMDFFTAEVPNTQRIDDLLCAVLHPLGESPSAPGRIHAVPGSGMDGAAGTKHDHGGVGMPESLPLSAA